MRLPALDGVGDELQLTLERVGGGREVLAGFLQVGDRLQRGRRQLLVGRDQRPVDVGDEQP